MDDEREEELWDLLRQAARLSDDEFERLKRGGLQLNYLRICPRKLWLFAHQVRLEADAEAVALGRLTHERAYRDRPRRSLILENLIAIDILEDERTLLEVKHAPTFVEAARLQLRYYLYFLGRRGISLRGELRFPRQRRREAVELDPAAIAEVEAALEEAARIVALSTPPAASYMPACRRCAYAPLCWG
ncbi:MAG: CRISPR-associated protein Cas4 [Thermoflexus sp.]|uniref:CRISPR-associated protein Cas4 n=1 Tax=Thermoflexus sp. TaxID=1969742 RepID=UPI0025F15DDF|nr:CRISPR-associated protein Cas4 [Thermoflexus sp.]MCS6964857.1 CRISPR-associated protein Cas4 [Thermoflexus sp.]MDW8186339.1 CRISPR-associated protein Cas4 [Anaerolineae bacterium]